MSKRGAANLKNDDNSTAPHDDKEVLVAKKKKKKVESATSGNQKNMDSSGSTIKSRSSSSSSSSNDNDTTAAATTPTTLTHQKVLTIVFHQGFLHWSDAVALGGTCKEFHQLYQDHSTKILTPLLEQLETMVKSKSQGKCHNILCYCIPRKGSVLGHDCRIPFKDLDPRFLDCYDDWSSHKKCGKMVEFISTLVTNMRRHMSPILDDPTPRVGRPIFSNRHTSFMGYGNEAEAAWLQFNKNRGTLVLNLAIVSLAQQGMRNNPYFDDAFLGVGGAYLGGGPGFERVVRQGVFRMFPLRDEDIMTYWQKSVYPSPTVLELLGPILVQKVWLSAPLFRLVPPQKQAPYQVDITSNLPITRPLEEINDEMIRENGVGNYL